MKKIKGDKLELIKYINTHTSLSDLFLKNIATSDKLDIEKYDKISQTLLFNKDVDKKLKLELERKVKTKQSLSKLRVTNNLMKMNKEVKMEEQILDKYKVSNEWYDNISVDFIIDTIKEVAEDLKCDIQF